MNTFDELITRGQYTDKAMRNTFESHRDVWSNAEHRQMAMAVFLRMGTNMVLANDADRLGILQAILLLECHDGQGDFNDAYEGCKVKGLSLSMRMR